jgi:hypothetical protein
LAGVRGEFEKQAAEIEYNERLRDYQEVQLLPEVELLSGRINSF